MHEGVHIQAFVSLERTSFSIKGRVLHVLHFADSRLYKAKLEK
jgi:hypothetical protein